MSRQSPPPITLNSSTHDLTRGATNVPATESISIDTGESTTTRSRPPSRILTPQSPTTASPIASPNPVYQNQSPIESSELLLPPASRGVRFSQYQDSPLSSRRSSWSTEAGNRDSRYGPFASPFDESRNVSRAGSPDPMEPLNMQNITQKYNITPSAGLLLFPNDKEDDDALHDPSTGMERDRECDIFTKRGLINVGGLALIVAGILVLFIGYPVLYVVFAISCFLTLN